MHHRQDRADARALVAQPNGRPRRDTSISAEALARLPSLSLRRWDLRSRCGRPPASAAPGKTVSARRGACAKVRNPSDIGAEQNHLCPVQPVGIALGQGCRGGRPQVRTRPVSRSSPCPESRLCLSASGRADGVMGAAGQFRLPVRRPAPDRPAARAPRHRFMVSGQQWPGSTWLAR